MRPRLDDLAADPARAVEVRVVEGVVGSVEAARVDDVRPALAIERDVVRPGAPAAIAVAVDRVELGRVQWQARERPEPPPARGVERAVLVARIPQARLPRARMGVGEEAVDAVAPVAAVLRVRPLLVAEVHELARRDPVVAAVARVGERRVPVPPAPEQPQLVALLDRVRVGVAEPAGHVGVDGVDTTELGDRVRVQARPVAHPADLARRAGDGPSAARRRRRCARRDGRPATGCCGHRRPGRGRSASCAACGPGSTRPPRRGRWSRSSP